MTRAATTVSDPAVTHARLLQAPRSAFECLHPARARRFRARPAKVREWYSAAWVGLDAGVVAIAESFQADELGPVGAKTKVAPILGAGIGVDWVLGSHAALGPSLRTFVIPLPGNADWLPARGTTFATQFGASPLRGAFSWLP